MASKVEAFIVGAKRVPFGAFGGALKDLTPVELGEVASRAALEQAGVDAAEIDHVVFGNMSPFSIYAARQIGLRIGVPVEAGAYIVHRLCGSGFQAVISAVQQLWLGESQLVLAGGTESPSQAPFFVRNLRFGSTLGKPHKFEDYLIESHFDRGIMKLMGECAENVAVKYSVSREDADAYALRSQHLWRQAYSAGIYAAELVPMKLKTRTGERVFDADEYGRDTSISALAALPSMYKKKGVVTAGNTGKGNDGAAALVLASGSVVAEKGLKPLARVVAFSIVGVEPSLKGIGPVPAIHQLLKKTGLKIEDIDIFQMNEAFAATTLAAQRELGIPMERLNPNGDSIAIGHALSATGARISCHIAHELCRRKLKYGIGTTCIGGGQGIAILFENAQS